MAQHSRFDGYHGYRNQVRTCNSLQNMTGSRLQSPDYYNPADYPFTITRLLTTLPRSQSTGCKRSSSHKEMCFRLCFLSLLLYLFTCLVYLMFPVCPSHDPYLKFQVPQPWVTGKPLSCICICLDRYQRHTENGDSYSSIIIIICHSDMWTSVMNTPWIWCTFVKNALLHTHLRSPLHLGAIHCSKLSYWHVFVR